MLAGSQPHGGPLDGAVGFSPSGSVLRCIAASPPSVGAGMCYAWLPGMGDAARRSAPIQTQAQL